MPSVARYRAWCFTDNVINTWTTLPSGVDYLCWQNEKATRLHVQGYAELSEGKPLAWLKANISSTAHWERRMGTQAQAINYCKKLSTRVSGPFELGEKKKAGQRIDIDQFRDAIMQGHSFRALAREYSMPLARYHKFYHMMCVQYPPLRTVAPKVVLLLGPPGCGKTRYAYDAHADEPDELYITPVNIKNLWLDGYDRHKYALIDEFSGNIPLVALLRLIDRYVCKFQVKGGHVWFAPQIIYLTSNIEPRNWYKWNGREMQLAALQRRFSQVLKFSNGKFLDVTLTPGSLFSLPVVAASSPNLSDRFHREQLK